MIERARDQAVGSFDSGAVGCAADQVADFERMAIPWDKWRFCDANAQYAVCGTSPASAATRASLIFLAWVRSSSACLQNNLAPPGKP